MMQITIAHAQGISSSKATLMMMFLQIGDDDDDYDEFDEDGDDAYHACPGHFLFLRIFDDDNDDDDDDDEGDGVCIE